MVDVSLVGMAQFKWTPSQDELAVDGNANRNPHRDHLSTYFKFLELNAKLVEHIEAESSAAKVTQEKEEEHRKAVLE